MAVRSIQELKSLWINGFVPDENDYIDLFDTMENLPLTNSTIEGEWTPILTDKGGGANYTIGTLDHARYVRNGNMVFISAMMIDIQNISTATGQLVIEGLPFTIAYDSELSPPSLLGTNIPHLKTRGVFDSALPNEIQLLYKTSSSVNGESFFSSVDFFGGQVRISGVYITNQVIAE